MILPPPWRIITGPRPCSRGKPRSDLVSMTFCHSSLDVSNKGFERPGSRIVDGEYRSGLIPT